jgi:hypothetical protein
MLLDTTHLDADAAFTAAMALLNTKLSSHHA